MGGLKYQGKVFLAFSISIVVAMGIRPPIWTGWVGSDVEEEGATRVASSCRTETHASWQHHPHHQALQSGERWASASKHV
ncbi:hypothetical protein B0T10DRAFT_228109 [Thelonectria olida]|uniref:Uncharacterized protein n=1 Tax=Thelonectria olida TaxID=1576542 RepID=A0A9P8WG53_9HYPO|nr:hypothetical protein B0T10DRAFT_228109 [Thelonectria olida]